MSKKQSTNIALICSAAILLCAGGAAVYFGMRSVDEPADSDGQQSSAQEQSAENGKAALIHPSLTEQADSPGMHGLSQTGSGMFFIGEESGGKFSDYSHAIRYYDTDSGETVYLCARPNCLHDGDEFCTATTSNYEIASDPVYLDGAVYAVAVDHSEQLAQSNLKYRTVLLRYAADGTEITKIADLHEDAQEKNDWYYSAEAQLTAHRGQLWIKCRYTRTYDISDPNLAEQAWESVSGYDTFSYEPAENKLTRLVGTDTLIKDFHETSFKENFSGSGDYVYFIKTGSNWQDPVKGKGIFRIDCRSGSIEQVIKPGNGMSFAYYAVAGDKIVYNEWSSVHEEHAVFQAYNAATGKTKELVSLLDVVLTAHPDYDAHSQSHYSAGYLLCDENYVFIYWDYYDDKTQEQPMHLSVYDWDGNFKQTVTLSLPNITDADFVEQFIENTFSGQNDEDTEKYIADLRKNGLRDSLHSFWESDTYHYDDGVFYFKGQYQECMLPLSDVLAGKATITPLYLHQRLA